MSCFDVIDPQVMQRLRDLARQSDPELIPRLIDIFLEDSPPRLVNLRHALEQGDRTRLAAVAHGLGGSARALGLSELAAQCLRLEDLPPAGSLVAATQLVREVYRAFDLARAALEKMRRPTTPD